jgi:hypothetical protein
MLSTSEYEPVNHEDSDRMRAEFCLPTEAVVLKKDNVMTALSNQICHSHIRARPVNSVLSAIAFLQSVH